MLFEKRRPGGVVSNPARPFSTSAALSFTTHPGVIRSAVGIPKRGPTVSLPKQGCTLGNVRKAAGMHRVIWVKKAIDHCYDTIGLKKRSVSAANPVVREGSVFAPRRTSSETNCGVQKVEIVQ